MLAMQPDGLYYRGDDEDAVTPETPLSDAATAIVMNSAYEPSTSTNGVLAHHVVGDHLLEDMHMGVHLDGRLVGSLVGSLQSLGPGPPLGAMGPSMSSLQRHAGGKRVLFVSGGGGDPQGHPAHRHHHDMDSGEEADDGWGPSPGNAHHQWSTPLVAATSRPQAPRVRPDSSMDSSRTQRGESVSADWTATHHNFHVGIYGWRKRCLYLLILALLVMVIVNLALTLWVLKVMEFSSEGMGQLRVVRDGLQLNGQAMVMDALIASNIRSRRGQPITIESSRNFTLNVRDEAGAVASQMYLDKNRLECATGGFRVEDSRGRTLFSADKKEVVVGASLLRVTGQGGAVFNSSVQTPAVRADSGSDLRLESPTRRLSVHAPMGVAIESRAGDISASCLTDLKLQSVAGSIRLDAARVMLPGMRMSVAEAGRGQAPKGRQEGRRRDEIYQLCMCGNGKLFLSAAEGLCAADDDSSVCR
ncbi:delta-sarcoglycan isoform X2 [Frankliniella occidentalis]|uniref:Delta-sarcoglycan isoform X2 n=1 Tax=Frankliniella occidentalis TaxID=133901 RepID=A0A9C6X2K3_FRAOC|nr:delta-sarcoglycan isoform X2 [Frankliniella occidentalis]